MNFVLDVDSFDLPRVAVAKPEIRDLDLAAILDDLFEDTVVVTDAVAPSWVVQGGHGVQKTGCETAQATVSQSSVGLLLVDGFQLIAK